MPAVLLILLASLCFGTTGTAQALLHGTDPVTVGLARIAIGGVVLGAIGLLPARRSIAARPPSRPEVGTIAVGTAGVLVYQPAFFLGTLSNGVAVGTVVALGSSPVITGALAWALRRERPGAAWAVATALAAAGVAVLAFTGNGPRGGVQPLGVLASLVAGLAYAAYTLAGKRIIEFGRAPSVAMAAMFGAAGVVSVVLLAVLHPAWLGTGSGIGVAMWLGLVTTSLAYLLFGAGLAWLRPATVSTLTLAEPLTATVLGVALLGERLDGGTVLGLLVLAAGLVVLAIDAGRSGRMPVTPA